mmetsp:Transcript_4584/g.13216  ORF Transcript_4584/g.13216 Transcript_4584/m.13216 type:complete len:231 (-) Transcript_4584:43-735(-)
MNIQQPAIVALLSLIACMLSAAMRPRNTTTSRIPEHTLAIFKLLQVLLHMPILWPTIRMTTTTTTNLHLHNTPSLDLLAMLAMPQPACTIDALATIIMACQNIQSPLLPSILPFHTIHRLILPDILAAPRFLTSSLTAFLHAAATISMAAMLLLTKFAIATTTIPMTKRLFLTFVVLTAPLPTPPPPRPTLPITTLRLLDRITITFQLSPIERIATTFQLSPIPVLQPTA